MPKKKIEKNPNYTLYLLVFAIFLTASLVIYTGLRIANNANILVYSPKSLGLEDKDIIAQDNTFTLYFSKIVKAEENNTKAEIALYNKEDKQFNKISGTFNITGAPSLISDDEKKYAVLTTGTFVTRTISIISIKDKKQTFSVCAVGEPHFYKENIVYQTCDKFSNRPWGAGEAPGISILNLESGISKNLFISDEKKHYSLTLVNNNSVEAKEISVENDKDWENRSKQKVEDVSVEIED